MNHLQPPYSRQEGTLFDDGDEFDLHMGNDWLDDVSVAEARVRVDQARQFAESQAEKMTPSELGRIIGRNVISLRKNKLHQEQDGYGLDRHAA